MSVSWETVAICRYEARDIAATAIRLLADLLEVEQGRLRARPLAAEVTSGTSGTFGHPMT